ncbi:MAG: efflux RND transporter permease subunit, partial [Candidatus Micrarchaeaceae archaeon]
MVIPKGLLPSTDSGMVFGFTQAAQGISFDSMKAHQKAVSEIFAKDPNVNGFMSYAGASGNSPAQNTGFIYVSLTDHPQRKLTTDQVIAELRRKVAQIPGIETYLVNRPPIRIGGHLTKGLYQYTLQSPDTETLYKVSEVFERKVAQLPGLVDVNSDLQMANPQVNVEIDRDKASTLGVTPYQIEEALSIAFGDNQTSLIYAPNNEYWVIAELLPQYQQGPVDLSQLYVSSTGGSLVPLSAVAKLTQSVGPLVVNHAGQLPAVTVSFNLKQGESIGQAVSEVQRVAREVVPATITGSFQGAAQAFQSSLVDLGFLLIITIVVIYILLGVLYESFVHPITIL